MWIEVAEKQTKRIEGVSTPQFKTKNETISEKGSSRNLYWLSVDAHV